MTAFLETENAQREATWLMKGMTLVWDLCWVWFAHLSPLKDTQEKVIDMGQKFVEEMEMKDLGWF